MRRLAYYYLIIWPMLTVVFTAAVDFQASVFRHDQMLGLAEEFLSDTTRAMYEAVSVGGIAAIRNDLDTDFESFDVYLANRQQVAITSPRRATKGDNVANKTIVRAIESDPGEVNSWFGNSSYEGVPVVAAYTSVIVDGEKLALIVSVDQDEIASHVFQWWVFADVVWISMFSTVGGLCVVVLRKDILRIIRPAEERSADAGANLIRLIRQFPSDTIGVALVNSHGVITDCSVTFANVLGAILSREISGKSLCSFWKAGDLPCDEESYLPIADIDEMATECIGVNGISHQVYISVVRLKDGAAVTLKGRVTKEPASFVEA